MSIYENNNKDSGKSSLPRHGSDQNPSGQNVDEEVGMRRQVAMTQDRAPIFKALNEFKQSRLAPFDVPGHKRGRGNPELTGFLGKKCLSVDVNSMKPLDNLCNPTSVIRDAEILTAAAFGASGAFLMVNGTTSSVQAMILYVCKRGDKIILPRQVHRSVINALILCGAIPVYINPKVNDRLGISLGMSIADIKSAIAHNPDAKAIFVNNPTYYGICSNLLEITRLAHENGMLVLVDEAHGTHFYFGDGLPATAMAVGADMSSIGMHKSGSSLTQSSLLLCGPRVNTDRLRQIVNLTQTTSPSYLLLSSLDLSRKTLSLNGRDILRSVSMMAEYARDEINLIGDYYAFSSELIDGDATYDFDITKLSINTLDLGLAGIEVYDFLRDEYDIQIEFGDIGNILAYLSFGDNPLSIEMLVGALKEIRRRHKRMDKSGMLKHEYVEPIVLLSPQDAFYAEKERVLLNKECIGRICTEFVMCYPPGIPIIAPGEKITTDVYEYIRYTKEKNCLLMGTEDAELNYINVIVF